MAKLDVSALEGKLITKGGADFKIADDCEYIGLYFSAHWCPPCRGFTPVFAELYKDKATESKTEVIFLSSDRDEESFNEYFASMPWAALKYCESECKQNLSKQFEIRGIPSLLIFNKAGDLITTDGRSIVAGGNMNWEKK